MATAAQPPPLVPEEGDDDDFSGYANTILSLFRSGHPKWGFLIYRTTYDDDDAWNRFMDVFTRIAEHFLRKFGKQQRLQPYLHWTVMDDRTAFENASKDAIRDHFRNWIDTRSVERDGPGADRADITGRSPRYNTCVYVDKAAVEEASMELGPRPEFGIYRYKGRVILIDAQFGQHLQGPTELTEFELQEIANGEYTMEDIEEDDEYELIEGRSEYDVGWMYVKLEFVSAAYEELAAGLHSWTRLYKRPPKTFP